MIKLPDSYTDRMKDLLKGDYDDYLNALEEAPKKAFRVNTDKISLDDFRKINPFGNKEIDYCENGFYLNLEKAGNHPYHHAGMIYIQEPAAIAPAECVTFDNNSYVLDMCAAPGGKSTQLKNKLGDKGILVSNEIIPSRCKTLTGNIERLGLKNCITTCMDTQKLAKVFPKTFDFIMCDAPCSGEGMFRKEQAAVSEWSEENVKMCAMRQSEILENAALCLKDGGVIVYATCTFSLEENEMVIDSFLKNHPEFEIARVSEKVEKVTEDGIFFDGCETENIRFSRRFYPHKAIGEGQFMAVLKNKLEKTDNCSSPSKMTCTDKTVLEFLESTLVSFDKSAVKLYNNNPVYFENNFDIKDGTAFSYGVTIGEIKKNYILPHHQFFMALGNSFKRKIELSLDDERVTKYLHGEEIEASCDNGWAAVLVDGVTLGGAKVVGGVAKNHYPKGLRIK